MGLLLRAFHPFAIPSQKHIKDSKKLIISLLYHFAISKVIDIPTPKQLILPVFILLLHRLRKIPSVLSS